jgi:hypothetical protein
MMEQIFFEGVDELMVFLYTTRQDQSLLRKCMNWLSAQGIDREDYAVSTGYHVSYGKCYTISFFEETDYIAFKLVWI